MRNNIQIFELITHIPIRLLQRMAQEYVPPVPAKDPPPIAKEPVPTKATSKVQQNKVRAQKLKQSETKSTSARFKNPTIQSLADAAMKVRLTSSSPFVNLHIPPQF